MKQENKIGVFVRVRPYQEREETSSFIVDRSDIDITVKDKDRDREQQLRFSFDHIFGPQSQQKDLFNRIGQPIVNTAFEGINGTIFAYGQTSSGKTFTCVGPDCQDAEMKGLLPRSVDSIFERISNSPNYLQFRIKVSMIEIYMEKIRDLLDPSKSDLKIRQNKSKGIYIQDVTEDYVSSAEQTMKVFKKGVSNRAVAYTNMNDASSRSHMAFILTLHQNNLKDGSAKSGKITVVDLAGSQKVSKTLAEGKILGQAKNINKSLSALGNVINALTDAKQSHIPYRDSKLTRLLQQSLGGNSRTHLIINISPSSFNASESVSSLRFGFRAKQIQNKPKINRQYTISEVLVLLQKSEKRNKQLQLLLNELTLSASKKAKKKEGFVQNLLQSDNAMISEISDNQTPRQKNPRQSALLKIKKFYESQVESEDENQNKKALTDNSKLEEVKLQKDKEKGYLRAQLEEVIAEKDEQIQILGQELSRINNERVNLVRELDICQERLDCATKEARITMMKVNSQKRQSQSLLHKYIKENLEKQEKQEIIKSLHSKIVHFEQKILRLSQLHKNNKKKNNVFGTNLDLNEETALFLQETLNDQQNESYKKQALSELQKDKKIEQLNNRIRQLQTDLSTYQHLEESKQGFITQKLKFVSERDQMFRDLQNRIQKVLELEEQLDAERDKRKCLEEMINMEQSSKTKKIQSLESQLKWANEQYYVLKGQQSSWKRNNEKLQQEKKENIKRIYALEADNLQLKVQIESLSMRCEDLEKMNENTSMLDFEVSEIEGEGEGTGNIVKVLRSNIFDD